ncbi:MAG: cytochrome b [Betaproteobacteria bacterium]
MSGSEFAPRYPTAVIVMHWAIAVAVTGLIVLGWWMQTVPKLPVGPRADAYNLHKSIGLAALALMAVRLAWRASHRPPALPPLPLSQARAAVAVHLLLYAVMFIDALSGYIGSATSGYPVKFFGWVLPFWAGTNDAVKEACSLVHFVSNWVLVAAIGAHVAATIYHQWVLHDGLLWRMWLIGERSRKGAVELRSPG